MALPNGYTKLEYIESTGTQYISTGITPTENTKIVIEFNSSSSSGVVFGQDSGYKVNAFMFAMTVVVFDSTKKDISISANAKHTVQVAPKAFKVDNGSSQYIYANKVKAAYPMFLFGNNRNGKFSEGVAMKLYSFKVYENDVLIADYIPCRNDNTTGIYVGAIGLWDDVNNLFYPNAGTGTFIAGELPTGTHKTLVNGTAYTVKGGKCMVNGTVYNILKGRTLIDGTGYDITFPSALTMPVKGDLITMNLDGTDRQYRVLKIVDGTTVEVLSMEDAGSSVFGSSNTYAGNTLDAYLNTTCYNTLSTAAKAAIVPKNIAQYRYNYSASVYNATTHSSFAVFSTKALYAGIGDRYVYALGVEDIEDYFNHTFSNADIWGLFWNTTTKPSGGGFPWLRDASTYINRYVWEIDYSNGYVGNSASYNSGRIRPAFQIDLSKIDFTIGGGSVSKTWTFNSTVNSPASTLTILYANFTSNGTKFKAFNCDVLAGALNLSYLYLNQDASHTQLNVYYYNWQNEAYRTVTFDEAPSGDLLTWLQANATPQ